jgi:ketosteroid isomerase-like protein
MKRLQLFMAVAITLFVGCNKPAVDQPNNEELKKIINEKNARIAEFYHQGLADSVASFFADDAIQMAPNQKPSIGAENIKESWAQVMQFGIWTFSLIAEEVKSCGNIAVERGKYTLTFEPFENSPIPSQNDSGNYLVFWEKIDGEWKAVWDAPVSEVPIQGAE